MTTPNMPATREYETLDAAVESCMMSRIYNGFHFRSGQEAGFEMGRDRAAHILDTQPQVMPKKNRSATIRTLNVDGVTPVSVMCS